MKGTYTVIAKWPDGSLYTNVVEGYEKAVTAVTRTRAALQLAGLTLIVLVEGEPRIYAAEDFEPGDEDEMPF